MQSRNKQEQRIIEGIFTGISRQSPLEKELLAVNCAHNRPDAIPWQRASEIYIENALNGASDLAQAALWCMISGKKAKISDEVMDIYTVLTLGRSKWESRAELIEEIAEKAAAAELTAPSVALLQRMQEYVSNNKALKSDKNQPVKKRIEEALSDVIANQHAVYSESTPNERFANALKEVARTKEDKFEILTEAYYSVNDPTLISPALIDAGRALLTGADWSQRVAQAKQHIQGVSQEQLSIAEETYLRIALNYIKSNNQHIPSNDAASIVSDISMRIDPDKTIHDVKPIFGRYDTRRIPYYDLDVVVQNSPVDRLPRIPLPSGWGVGHSFSNPDAQEPQRRSNESRPDFSPITKTVKAPSEQTENITSMVPYNPDNVQVILLRPKRDSNKNAQEPIKAIDVTEYVEQIADTPSKSPAETAEQTPAKTASDIFFDTDYMSFLHNFTTQPAKMVAEQPFMKQDDRVLTWNEANQYGVAEQISEVTKGTAVITDSHGTVLDFDKPITLTPDSIDKTYLLTTPKNKPDVSWSGRRIINPVEADEDLDNLRELVESSGPHRIPTNSHDDFLREYSGLFSIPLMPSRGGLRSAIAAGILTLMLSAGGVGVYAWASSSGPNNPDYSFTASKLKNAVVIVDKKEETKPAEPQVSQEEQDKQFCDEQLLGKNHDTSGRGILAKLKKADLEELTQACFKRQVQGMVDPNFMKGTDPYQNYSVVNQPYSPNDIYARTFIIEYTTPEGGTEKMPLTFFDPLGARSSKIMSQWNAPRGGVYEYDKNGNITGCKPGQRKAKMVSKPDPKNARRLAKAHKYDPKTASSKTVDATDIAPVASLDKIAADAEKQADQPEDKSVEATNEADEGAKQEYIKNQQPAKSTTPAKPTAPSSNPVPRVSKQASSVKYSCRRYHGGLDLVDKTTTWKDFMVTDPMIYAPLPGRIKMIIKGAHAAGNYVQTEHVLPNGKTIRFEYMHMGEFSPWVETLYQKHKKGSMAVFKSGEGAQVYPFVFNTLVSYVSDQSQLTEAGVKQYKRFGVALGEMGHSGNADIGAEHLHIQFKILDSRGDTKLVNPELILPVLQKGLGLKWFNEDGSSDYAEILNEMAALAGLDAEFLQEIRAHESDRMEAVSSANAYGFMQLRQNGAGWGAKQTLVEKSRLEKQLQELEQKKIDKSAKGENVDNLEDLIADARTKVKTISYFANGLNENGAWRRIKNDPFANMFAGVMTAKANYAFFGGTIYQQALKSVYEKALESIKKDGGTKNALLDELDSGRHAVRVNRILTEDYGAILAREVEFQYRNTGKSDAKTLLDKAYESALENTRLEMYRRTASGYNAGHGATINAIESAQKKDQIYKQSLQAAAKAGDVERFNQIREQREKNHWTDFIYSGTKAYAQGVIEGMVFRVSYATLEDDKEYPKP